MPQRRTSIKELRKNHTRHMHNLDIKTDLKKTVKKFIAASEEKSPDTSKLLSELYKKMDKAAKRNVLHKKTAARRKARFAKLIAAQVPAAAPVKKAAKPAAKATKTTKTTKTTKAKA